ncbi:hypothetical protein A9Z42_0008540 [Trichoderma parareesei]|uniref:Uncharacterized protein n=1 Tax=Trichoderma parareesei TaxID=858221 RepID=A0A2H2ZBV9_TRIPA|nr:hypothetical protein A9Z42_0008540 [Trichoderma parareesei]
MGIMQVLHALHVVFVFLWPIAKEIIKIGAALLLNAHIRAIIRDEIGPLAERFFRWRNEQRELAEQRRRQAQAQAQAQARAENARNAQREMPREEPREDVHVPKRAKTRDTTYRRYKRRGRHANPRQRKARHAEERRRADAAAAKRVEE